MMQQSNTAPWFRSIGFKLALFLSFALFPIGVIAIYQTQKVAQEAQQRLQQSLLALTERAAAEERQVIQRAFGAAEAFGSMISVLSTDMEACRDYMDGFLGQRSEFSFIGFLPTDGMMRCSSAERVLDMRDNTNFQQLTKDPRPLVTVNARGAVSGVSVLVVWQPIYADEELQGFVAISVPHRIIQVRSVPPGAADPLALLTFNADGSVLTASIGLENANEVLPMSRRLATESMQAPVAFTAESAGGERQLYVIAPVIRDTVYALGVWSAMPRSQTGFTISSALFPILMWLASVLVAYFAIDRVAVRHIRGLGQQMRRFATTRYVPDASVSRGMSSELVRMEEDFLAMADSILRDEAELENAVRQKNVLLKEVHHRVKNNLQMISSIMNMHIRKTKSPETQTVLRRLQERVLGLASIHRNLHQIENQGRINTGPLIRDISDQLLASSMPQNLTVRVEKDIDDVVLYPDQSIPLTLLMSEALANALKFVQPTEEGGEGLVRLTLAREMDGRVTMEIANSLAGEGVTPKEEDYESTGLGSQLIRAFAMQLGADTETGPEDGEYRVKVAFEAENFKPDPLDY